MSNSPRPRTSQAALTAMSFLPPDMASTLKEQGFTAVRIEDSGALCFCLSNKMAVKDKQNRLRAFRAAAEDYGLDLQRVLVGQSPDQPYDNGILLAAKPVGGQRVPLFTKRGEPATQPEPAEEVTRPRERAR